MFAIAMSALLQATSGDMPIEQAEAFARRDEATLSGDFADAFFDRQGKAMGRALVNCGAAGAHEASGLKVVMKLDAQGQVTKTWLNKSTVLGQCFERELQSATFPMDGRSEFYTFIGFTF